MKSRQQPVLLATVEIKNSQQNTKQKQRNCLKVSLLTSTRSEIAEFIFLKRNMINTVNKPLYNLVNIERKFVYIYI